jgi:O-antigen/teichoic acid export membrane protein
MYFSNISGYYGGIFAAFKNTKIMGITTIIAAVINVIINLLLIKNIGIWAAAISTFCATATIYFYRKIKIKEHIKLEENGLNTFLSIISVIIACSAYYSENIFLQVITFLVLGIYCCIINKETVKTFCLIFFKNKLKHTN